MQNKKLNKKAQLDRFMNIILWIIFFVMCIIGIYLLIKTLTGA